jgi:hypothetical protein
VTKKTRYFTLRRCGADHDKACQRARITNPQVGRQYRREWEAQLTQPAAPTPPVAPAWIPRLACGRCGAIECQCEKLEQSGVLSAYQRRPDLPASPALPDLPEPSPATLWGRHFVYEGQDATPDQIQQSVASPEDPNADAY